MGSYLGDKKRAKRRKRKGKYNEYIDRNIGWVVIWVTGVMECARCSRALLPLRPLSQKVSKKGNKLYCRKVMKNTNRRPLSQRVSKKGDKVRRLVMKKINRSNQRVRG